MIEDPDERRSVLAMVATITAEVGDLELAVGIFEKVESGPDEPGLLDEPLASIAARYAVVGEVDRALSLVERIYDPGRRAVALTRIAVTLPP